MQNRQRFQHQTTLHKPANFRYNITMYKPLCAELMGVGGQAYFVIKAAQEKEELKMEVELREAKVAAAKKELEGLRLAASQLTASTQDLAQSLRYSVPWVLAPECLARSLGAFSLHCSLSCRSAPALERAPPRIQVPASGVPHGVKFLGSIPDLFFQQNAWMITSTRSIVSLQAPVHCRDQCRAFCNPLYQHYHRRGMCIANTCSVFCNPRYHRQRMCFVEARPW